MKFSWKFQPLPPNLLKLIPLLLLAWMMTSESRAVPVQAKWNLNEVHTAELLIEGTLPDLSDPAWVPYGQIPVPVGSNGATRDGLALTVPSPQPDKPWNAYNIYFQYNRYYEKGGALLGADFEVGIYAKHMVKGTAGTGHKDEEAPSRNNLLLFANSLSGLSTGNADVDAELAFMMLSVARRHTDGIHQDTGRLRILDKNGKAPGKIGAERAVEIIATYQHPVPDTGSSLGLLLGAFGMLSYYRGRRRAC